MMSITEKVTMCQKGIYDFLVYLKDSADTEAYALADKISKGDERCVAMGAKRCDNVFSASSAMPMHLITVKCKIYEEQELNRDYVLGRINS